jgi:hypothetical protein
VVCPNKHREGEERFYKGRLLQSETYIGGKVEAIESGVFRSDIPMAFHLQSDGYQYLIDRHVLTSSREFGSLLFHEVRRPRCIEFRCHFGLAHFCTLNTSLKQPH